MAVTVTGMQGSFSTYLTLRLRRHADDVEGTTWLRKSLKALALVLTIFPTLARYGPAAARHAFREQWLLRHILGSVYSGERWFRFRAVKAAKMACKMRNPASGEAQVAEVCGLDTAIALSHDSVETNRAAFDAVVRDLDPEAVLDLYQYFIWFGDFRLAAYFRRATIEATFREQLGTGYLLPYAMNAALEGNEPRLALDFLRTKDAGTTTADYRREASGLATALTGELPRALEIWRSTFTDSDSRYLDFLGGRSVAVVGPAEQTENVGEEIDAFEVVIRTNFNPDARFPAELHGTRTDVSYYNAASWIHRRATVMRALDQLKWVNLKGQGTDRIVSEERPDFLGRTRVFYQLDRFFNLGGPMAIANIVFDLLRFSPSKLKLFGADFYAGGLNYHPTYFKGRESTQIPNVASLTQGLRMHETFGTFLFGKAILESGLMEADALTARALALDLDGYAAVIQETFGGYVL